MSRKNPFLKNSFSSRILNSYKCYLYYGGEKTFKLDDVYIKHHARKLATNKSKSEGRKFTHKTLTNKPHEFFGTKIAKKLSSKKLIRNRR